LAPDLDPSEQALSVPAHRGTNAVSRLEHGLAAVQRGILVPYSSFFRLLMISSLHCWS
jgi:hypothetical protein